MFDIGFAELLLIGVVGLLVVGPEQLPGAVRTVLAWVNRFRRSFDQIRTEVRRELHNDEIMQKLKAESRQLEQQVRDATQSVEHELQTLGADASASLQTPSTTAQPQQADPASPRETDLPDAPTKSA
ncbi:MAG: Sec-independent protein translocase protein TatB [Proteobacteria bacterium]|nr:twin-arginine translocase subunit TatB [Luminiphilus sp.]MDA0650364.1 Sec-independent protein translocase protein TatB [Pseudomonadota bacterium]